MLKNLNYIKVVLEKFSDADLINVTQKNKDE